jgi:hypothetical protein
MNRPRVRNFGVNFFVDKLFKDQYFGTKKSSYSVEIPKGRG